MNEAYSKIATMFTSDYDQVCVYEVYSSTVTIVSVLHQYGYLEKCDTTNQ